MTHTPGPWTVVPTLTGALSINKTPQVPIGMVGGAGWHLGEDVAKANAALIAAAPDLLEALRAMWRFAGALVEKHSMEGDDTMTDGEHSAWQNAAYLTSSAIAKAEGTKS